MGWRDLLGLTEPPQPAPAAPQDVSLEKIDFHIDRYERALAQCTKGRDRSLQLQRELSYWRGRRKTETLRRGS